MLAAQPPSGREVSCGKGGSVLEQFPGRVDLGTPVRQALSPWLRLSQKGMNSPGREAYLKLEEREVWLRGRGASEASWGTNWRQQRWEGEHRATRGRVVGVAVDVQKESPGEDHLGTRSAPLGYT